MGSREGRRNDEMEKRGRDGKTGVRESWERGRKGGRDGRERQRDGK